MLQKKFTIGTELKNKNVPLCCFFAGSKKHRMTIRVNFTVKLTHKKKQNKRSPAYVRETVTRAKLLGQGVENCVAKYNQICPCLTTRS